MKQPVDKGDLTGVVYLITCLDQDTKYIGETIQRLSTRTGQHENDCSEANLNKRNKNRTALATHVKETGHKFDFNLVKILKRERNKSKLQIQEVIQIIMHEGETCNFTSDAVVIGPAYGNLLTKYKATINKTRPTCKNNLQRTHVQHGFSPTSRRSRKDDR